MSKHYIVSENLIPEGNGSYSIGGYSNLFNDGLFSGNLQSGSVSVGLTANGSNARVSIKSYTDLSNNLAMSIDDSNDNAIFYVEDGGNISIGRSNPTAKLHIKSSGTSSGTFSFKIDDSDSNPLIHIREDGNTGIGASSENNTKLYVNQNFTGNLGTIRVYNTVINASPTYSTTLTALEVGLGKRNTPVTINTPDVLYSIYSYINVTTSKSSKGASLYGGYLYKTGGDSQMGLQVEIRGTSSYNVGSKVSVSDGTFNIGHWSLISGSYGISNIGSYNQLTGNTLTTASKKYGVYNAIQGTSSENYGVYSSVVGSSINYGQYISTVSSGGLNYGLYVVSNSGNENYGIIVADGSSIFNQAQSSETYFKVSTENQEHTLFIDNVSEFVGINTATPNALVDIKGTGTSSTYTFAVEDSTGKSLFKVRDNGKVGVGTASEFRDGEKLKVFSTNVGLTGTYAEILTSAAFYNASIVSEAIGQRRFATFNYFGENYAYVAKLSGDAVSHVAYYTSMTASSSGLQNKYGSAYYINGTSSSNTGCYIQVSEATSLNAGITAYISGDDSSQNYGCRFEVSGELNSSASKYGGNFIVTGTGSANYGINIDSSGASLNYGVFVERGTSVFNSGSYTDTDFIIQGKDTNRLFFVDSSSNSIGINNATPSYPMHVIGTVSTTAFRMTNGASSSYVLKSDSSGNATWQEDLDHYLFRLQFSAYNLGQDNTAYYGAVLSSAAVATFSNFHNYPISYNSKLRAYSLTYGNTTTNASGETSSLYLVVNNSTEYLLNNGLTFSGAIPVQNSTSSNTLNISLVAGDKVQLKLVTGAFTTNPGSAFIFADFHFTRT